MIIKIEHKNAVDFADENEEFEGAPILDADEGFLWLAVDRSEIDLDCSWWQVKEPYEFWGQKGMQDMVEYEIRSCTWNGHSVLNEEEVFEGMELRDE